MKAIFKKDFRSFFTSLSGFVIVAFTFACLGLYFSGVNLAGGYGDFSYALSNSTFIFLVIVPLLTMRSMVDERKQKTDQLLLTSPITPTAIILGKYFSLIAVYAVPLIGALSFPLILSLFGTVPLIKSYIAIALFFLMGCAAIAIGLFISCTTESIPIAAVGTFGVLLALFLIDGITSLVPSTASASLFAIMGIVLLFAFILKFMTRSSIIGYGFGILGIGSLIAIFLIKPALLEGAFGKILSGLSLFAPFTEIVTGMFNFSSVVYYISVSALFLFLCVQSLEKRRAG